MRKLDIKYSDLASELSSISEIHYSFLGTPLILLKKKHVTLDAIAAYVLEHQMPQSSRFMTGEYIVKEYLHNCVHELFLLSKREIQRAGMISRIFFALRQFFNVRNPFALSSSLQEIYKSDVKIPLKVIEEHSIGSRYAPKSYEVGKNALYTRGQISEMYRDLYSFTSLNPKIESFCRKG